MNVRRRALTAALIAGAVLLAGCSDANVGGAQQQGQKDTETAFRQQSVAVPYPAAQLVDSLERRNIKDRLLRTNKPNSIGYVYILSMTGQYVGYYVIKGKVSSTQSAMTTDQLVVWSCPNNAASCDAARMASNVVDAPGDDGSYGANEPGVYFFTAEGVMVTTSLPYIVSDAPLPVSAPKLNAAKVGP